MNKKDYKKIIDKLNKRLNTNVFNFDYSGGEFDSVYGKVDIHLHSYDKNDKLYSIFIKYHSPEQANEYIPMVNSYNGKANIHTTNIDEALNMIDYVIVLKGE